MYDGTIICWLLALGFFGVAAVWVIRDGRENDLHKRRRLGRRFCVQCGYDVHAGDGGRCPECGTEIPWGPPRDRGGARGEDSVR